MRLFLLLLLTAITICSQAQQINGLAKDEAGIALGGATVSLVKASDSSTVKLAVTKSNGSYSFSGIKDGNYLVLVTFVGYKPAFSPKFSFTSSELSLPDLA